MADSVFIVRTCVEKQQLNYLPENDRKLNNYCFLTYFRIVPVSSSAGRYLF